MSIIASQKFSRRIVAPLIVFWIIFQSMLFCAAILSNMMLPSIPSDIDISNDAPAFGMSAAVNDYLMVHESAAQLLQLHTLDESGHNAVLDNCCEEQDDYRLNASYASLLPVLLSFIPFWLIFQSKSKTPRLSYLREPDLRYNYPRHHLVNCTFLD